MPAAGTGCCGCSVAPTDVAIGHEVAAPCAGDGWVIGHYAADSTGCLAGWLHERALSLAS